MIDTYSFDFADRIFDILKWRIAFRIFSEDNVYTPDSQAVRIEKTDAGLTITADRFAWAGGQMQCPGRFEARIRYIDGGFDCDINASLHERIKGTTLYMLGVNPGKFGEGDMSFIDVPAAGTWRKYPNPMRLPVMLIDHGGTFTAAASLQHEVHAKSFSAIPSGDSLLLELHHHRDARHWSTSIETPTWRIIETTDPLPLLKHRMQIMEDHAGLKPWDTREDVPEWMRQVGMVINLHGMHWTGYLFNDYARMLKNIQYVAERLEGRRILAWLAAWDGRYNYNWPNYHANERMGGADGLKKLVEGAHALGVHVIPQIGAVSSNRRFTPPGLHDAASQDAYGNSYVKEVDWDNDRAGDTYRVNANIGHPGFCRFLFDETCRLKETFAFDGIFLDINQTYHNDPRFSIVEGHQRFANLCQERFDDFLVFGEAWYDALLSAYPLVHAANDQHRGYMLRWDELFNRYARNTWHLITPAPGPKGRGSTGVYEQSYRDPFVPNPDLNVIPAVSFVHDTLDQYQDQIDQRIDSAKRYIKRLGI